MGLLKLSSTEHCSTPTTCIQVDLWLLLVTMIGTVLCVSFFFRKYRKYRNRKNRIASKGNAPVAEAKAIAMAADRKHSVLHSRKDNQARDLWLQRQQVSQRRLNIADSISPPSDTFVSKAKQYLKITSRKEQEAELFQKPSYEQRRKLSIAPQQQRLEMEKQKSQENSVKRRVSISKESHVEFTAGEHTTSVYEILLKEIHLVKKIATSPTCELYCATWRGTEVHTRVQPHDIIPLSVVM